GFLEVLLGLAYPGDLRGGVDDPGDGVHVDVARLPSDGLGHRDPLLGGLVREHRAAHDVPDGIDVRNTGVVVVVDLDVPPVVDAQADRIRVQTRSVRHASDGDDQLVELRVAKIAVS